MTDGERIAFEEIYRLLLPRNGKAERKARAVCVEMIGTTRAGFIKAEVEAAKQRAAAVPGKAA